MSRKKRRPQPVPQLNPESRPVEALTVAWMLSVVTTVLFGLISAVVLLTLGNQADAEAPRAFGRLLHFGALVTAILSLILFGFVLKLRKHPPPASITWFALVAALLVISAAFLY